MHFSGLLKSLWAMCGSGPATRRVLFHWLLRRANAGRAAKKSRVRRRGRWKESYNKINILCALVDGVGFEPTVASPPRRFSRPVPSTTRPPILMSPTYCWTPVGARRGADIGREPQESGVRAGSGTTLAFRFGPAALPVNWEPASNL